MENAEIIDNMLFQYNVGVREIIQSVKVADEIGLINDLDLHYKPKFVPDPPPDFIAGIAIDSWQENN